MTTIVHRTPGLLDPRSFTVMGMSAKPTTGHPIGQFGTGLKYSIAGLLRAGASVSIWIGRDHWQFETHDEEFREERFTRIVAWVRRWGGLRRQRIELPFTTSLGPHWTWWMWLRELHSNTLDEQGETSAVEWHDRESGQDIHGGFWGPEEGSTLIVVDHPEYAAAWEARGDVFLEGGHGPADAGTDVLQVLPGPSSRVYYRGVRALETRLPCLRTWNVLQQTPLTEDRTMADWYARYSLARHIVSEETDEGLILSVLEASDEHWEHDLEFPAHIRPSPAFERAAARSRRLGPRASSYITRWAPPPPPDTRTFWERRGRRWKLSETSILDERGRPVLEQPETMSQEDWRDFSEAVVTAVQPVGEGTCPTCRQTVVPPPARAMVAADLYCGMDWHDFQTVWPDTLDGVKRDVCTMCGVVFDPDSEDDMAYAPCPGPAWMQPCTHETTSDATTGDGTCTVTTCLDCGVQTDIRHHHPDPDDVSEFEVPDPDDVVSETEACGDHTTIADD